jgi:DnaJ-class molecular chaperone
VQAVEQELASSRTLSFEKRKKVFKRLTLHWHPDKQKGNEDIAKMVFQHLQDHKQDYLQTDEPFSD